jgi:hypothetical protein
MVDINSDLPASARGWGTGWPNCQDNRITSFAFEGKLGAVAFPAGLRTEIVDLISHLLTETEDRGYLLHPGWCWGFGCRAIRGANVPSNHSWGLAVDINAPANPLGSTTSDMPSWIGPLWNQYGFRWGGNYHGRLDNMHFEFMGTPQDAEAMTMKARETLVTLTNEQAAELDWVKGFQSYMRGENEPKHSGPVRRGWNDAKVAVEGRPPAH